MKKHKNIVPHNPDAGTYGDCHRACFCTILGLEPEDVPHFFGDGPAVDAEVPWQRMTAFLAGRSLVQAHFIFPSEACDVQQILYSTGQMSPGVPMILGGKSNSGVGHSVVIMDGEIYNDPTGSGIIGPMDDGYYWVTIFSPKPALRALSTDEVR